MKDITRDLLLAQANAQETEEEQKLFLKNIETTLLQIRYKFRNFKVEYDREFFEKKGTARPHDTYIIPLWAFLYYSKEDYKKVIDLYSSFIKNDTFFLSMIDLERTASGAVRAITHLRFSGGVLKKMKVVSEEKRDDWKSLELTEFGYKQWELFEKFLFGETAFLQQKEPFDNKYFCNKKEFGTVAYKEFYKKIITDIKKKLKNN